VSDASHGIVVADKDVRLVRLLSNNKSDRSIESKDDLHLMLKDATPRHADDVGTSNTYKI
jgi:hypothetical protein